MSRGAVPEADRLTAVADPELRYLIDVCLDPGVAVGGAPWPAATVDGPRFLGLAERHRVVGLVAAMPADRAPRAVAAQFDDARAAQSLQFLGQVAETIEAVQALERAGLAPIILKGAPLAVALYQPTPESRQSIDVDVLVDARSFEQAEAVLHDAGYERTTPAQALPRSSMSMARHLLNAFEYSHRETGSKLELHHRLLLDPYVMQRPHAELLAASATVDLGGVDVRVLGRDDATLYLCCHGAAHLYFRLKWLVDVVRVLDAYDAGDIERLLSRAEASSCKSHVCLTLALIETLTERRFAAPHGVDRRAMAPLLKACLAAITAPERGNGGFRLADVPADVAEMVFGLRLAGTARSRRFKLLQHLTNHQDLPVLGLGVEWRSLYGVLGRPLAAWRWLARFAR